MPLASARSPSSRPMAAAPATLPPLLTGAAFSIEEAETSVRPLTSSITCA